MAIDTYDPSKVFVTYSGIPINTFAPDSVIEIGRLNPSFRVHNGCDGEVTRTKSKNWTGYFKISLLQTSGSHLALSSISLADEVTGLVAIPFFVLDRNSYRNLAFSLETWIEKPVVARFDKGIAVWEWTFNSNNLIQFMGGA
jgi:hypothetical protein